MCLSIEEMRNQAAAAAKMEERKAIAVSLWNEGIQDVDRIARLTKLSLVEVREIIGIKSE